MQYVIDYAFPPHPSVESLVATDCPGVMRYLSYRPNNKVITADEYLQLRTAGLQVGFVWEYDARDFVNSSFNSRHAAEVAEQILYEIGAPLDSPVYFAVDFDILSTQWAGVRQRLLDGPVTVLGVERVGIYGPYDALNWAHRDGVAKWFWQAGMSTAWSGGRNRQQFEHAHLVQVATRSIGGADCDLNRIIRDPFGGDMSTETDQFVRAIVDGIPVVNGVTICPVQWQQRMDTFQADVRAQLEVIATRPVGSVELDYKQLAVALLDEIGIRRAAS